MFDVINIVLLLPTFLVFIYYFVFLIHYFFTQWHDFWKMFIFLYKEFYNNNPVLWILSLNLYCKNKI